MKKLLLLFIVYFSLSFVCAAQDQNDIKGWNKTKWGMTFDNVIELYPGIEKKNNDLKLANYQIDKDDFDVFFKFDNNILKEVRLICSHAALLQFTRFEQLLTEKYGQPVTKNESPKGRYIDKNTFWLLPSTKIELAYINIFSYGPVLNIIYSDRTSNKEVNEKL